MNTREAIEKLPWLINGSLETAEAAAVRQQLADSEECRRELREIAEAGRLFGSRIAVETLLDYVAGRDVAPFERETIERFLNVSPTHLEEWRMASESWNGVARVAVSDSGSEDRATESATENVLPFRSRAERSERSARSWRGAAIAASLLAVLGVGGWWNELRDARPSGFNPTIVEVEAVDNDLVLRDGSPAMVPVVSSKLGPVQLSLTSMAGGTRYLELIDANGRVAWAPVQEFVADRYGSFIVALPDDLESGIYTVELYRGAGADREAAERYAIELR